MAADINARLSAPFGVSPGVYFSRIERACLDSKRAFRIRPWNISSKYLLLPPFCAGGKKHSAFQQLLRMGCGSSKEGEAAPAAPKPAGSKPVVAAPAAVAPPKAAPAKASGLQGTTNKLGASRDTCQQRKSTRFRTGPNFVARFGAFWRRVRATVRPQQDDLYRSRHGDDLYTRRGSMSLHRRGSWSAEALAQSRRRRPTFGFKGGVRFWKRGKS